MTVAAVVIARTAGDALRPVGGVSAARHVADAAWAGGAMPIVVVAPDPDGAVAASLAGSAADLVAPPEGPAPSPGDPASRPASPAGIPAAVLDASTGEGPGPVARGVHAAVDRVGETTAVLVWPMSMAWVDAATVTALLEAHASAPDSVIRPTWEGAAGWPTLVPIALLADPGTLAGVPDPGALLDALERRGATVRTLDLGDPGVTLSTDTARADLPAYAGPDQPVTGHPPDWGADVARVAPER